MKQTMLIADDSKMNREILEMLFHENYLILEAENGTEIFEIMESCQGNVDVVLLDLIMPDMDGFQVLEKRKEIDYFKDIPVIVITASSNMEDQLRAFELGASDFISKPFIPEIVVTRVNNVMDSNQRMLLVELEARKLKVKSELDQMTKLYNKTSTELYANEILSADEGQLHAMLVIDVDNFKSVNDNSGHLAGDHTIQIVANLISSQFRKTDIVGRIGGDEFVVLMANVDGMDTVRAKTNQLIQLMKYKPNLTLPENVTLSIGIASNEQKACSYPDLFEKADQALYEAKAAGKAQYREFGVAPINFADDQRPVVLLLSRERGVCSTVHAMMSNEIRIVEAVNVAAVRCLPDADAEKTQFSFIDVSAEPDDGSGIWRELQSVPQLKGTSFVAVCRESDMKQNMAALMAGAADIITTPIDASGFKRRVERLLSGAHPETD